MHHTPYQTQPRISITNETDKNITSSDTTVTTTSTTTCTPTMMLSATASKTVTTDSERDNKHYLCVDALMERDRLSYDFEMDREATPLISDLDELDTDYEHRDDWSAHSAQDRDDDNDVDSDTPEPLDTPLSLDAEFHAMQLFPVTLTPRDRDSDDGDNDGDSEQEAGEEKEEEDSGWDIDVDIDDDDDEDKEAEDAIMLPTLSLPRLVLESVSWEDATMTRVGYDASKRIKCITPITRQVAVTRIKDYSKAMRRRSVANITPSVHRLFPLDADLLQIRDAFECLQKEKETPTSTLLLQSMLSTSVSSPTADAQCKEKWP